MRIDRRSNLLLANVRKQRKDCFVNITRFCNEESESQPLSPRTVRSSSSRKPDSLAYNAIFRVNMMHRSLSHLLESRLSKLAIQAKAAQLRLGKHQNAFELSRGSTFLLR